MSIPAIAFHFWCAFPATARKQKPPRTEELPLAPPARADGNFLVRPGETVTLLWDQDGIRLLVPAVCLDRGEAGEPVRARIVRSGRMIRAIVESAGTLRAAS